ncbi:NINJ2-like protein [Mya arenaria]|uniref:NINJ2-like protein n=1 Tax=Mya arenaria TaxID=6604 RepID=A0ABY7FUV9_MYAAR|nr:NINJ2-like protein [Mya arenaria]
MSGATVEQEHRADDGNSSVGFRSYNTKKTLAEGLLDIGLLVANATQLKTLLCLGSAAEYYYPNLVFISLSVTLQIVTGALLLVLGGIEGKHLEERRNVNRLNNVIVGFVFAITVINVFVAAFGIKMTEN